jgi:diamine N-acetyltransferase
MNGAYLNTVMILKKATINRGLKALSSTACENETILLRKMIAAAIQPLLNTCRQIFWGTLEANNTAEDMQLYLDKNFNPVQLLAEINNRASEFYFALLADVPVGYLKLNLGNAQTELQTGNGTEIERIYVLQQFQGHKIGRFLFNKAIEVATTRQADYIWLGVWGKTPKPYSFIKKTASKNSIRLFLH